MIRIFVALLLLSLIPLGAKADEIIDGTGGGNPLYQFDAGTKTIISAFAGILGVDRDESVTVRDFGGFESNGLLVLGGELSIAMGSNDQIYGSQLYDGVSDFDLTEWCVNDSLAIQFLSNDIDVSISDVISITVTSGATSATPVLSIPPSSSLPSPVLVPFSSFTEVDIANADSNKLSYDF